MTTWTACLKRLNQEDRQRIINEINIDDVKLVLQHLTLSESIVNSVPFFDVIHQKEGASEVIATLLRSYDGVSGETPFNMIVEGIVQSEEIHAYPFFHHFSNDQIMQLLRPQNNTTGFAPIGQSKVVIAFQHWIKKLTDTEIITLIEHGEGETIIDKEVLLVLLPILNESQLKAVLSVRLTLDGGKTILVWALENNLLTQETLRTFYDTDFDPAMSAQEDDLPRRLKNWIEEKIGPTEILSALRFLFLLKQYDLIKNYVSDWNFLIILESRSTDLKNIFCQILEIPCGDHVFIHEASLSARSKLFHGLFEQTGGVEEVQRVLMSKNKQGLTPFEIDPDLNLHFFNKLRPEFVRSFLRLVYEGRSLLKLLMQAESLDRDFIKKIYDLDFDPKTSELEPWLRSSLQQTRDIE